MEAFIEYTSIHLKPEDGTFYFGENEKKFGSKRQASEFEKLHLNGAKNGR